MNITRRYNAFNREPALRNNYGPIISDVRRIFFNFNDHTLSCFLEDYKKRYGIQAHDYAKKTYTQWKKHDVHISEQTLFRICEILPPYLNTEQRKNLILKITQCYWRKPFFASWLETATWDNYGDIIESLMLKAKSHQIQDDIITKSLYLPETAEHLIRIFILPDLVGFWHRLNSEQYKDVIPDAEYACEQLYLFKLQAVNKMLADDIYESMNFYLDRPTLNIHLTITKRERTFWQRLCIFLQKIF